MNGLSRNRRIVNVRCELLEAVNALRRDNPELGQVCPHCIREHCALTHEQLARAVKHQHRLVLGRFNGHESHGGSRHCFRDRRSIGGVGLIALDIGLHVAGRHQAHVVAKRHQLACPIVCSRARFHADKAWRQ